ncbi:MAG: lysophospholipid acyltransferase family protein [Planctomycetaceae bacterium]
MQRVVIDEPYEFVSPYKGTFLSRLFRWFLPGHLRKEHGITEWECRGVENLKQSMEAGHGVLLCPNHCRPSDPMAMGLVNTAADCHTFSMASWHVFKQSRLQAFLTRQFGAFSIYREGMDRQALNAAMEIVVSAERPLIVFPEGVISRRNNNLLELMDGTAFIARSAAKKRAKLDPEKKVVVHPVALHYEFKGDLESSVAPVLDRIEQRLSWAPRTDLDARTRASRVAKAMLSLKELEHVGEVGSGDVYDRMERLIEAILQPLETEWFGGAKEGQVVNRVKNIRSAVLPDMVKGGIDESERQRRWKQLSAVYLAQQLSMYPRGYLDDGAPIEHLLETIEGLEEDLTDAVTPHPPMHLRIAIGKAIEVETKRPRGEADPLMVELRSQLLTLIGNLGREVSERRSK